MPARQHRVIRGEDYRRVVRAGRRVGGAFCITHALVRSEGEAARFGFIVSKAVGNAVTRNLIRRRMKTVAERRLSDGFTGIDVVFRALPAAATASFRELEREMDRAIDRVQRELAPGVQGS
ncbi:ribonuclease P protein component [Leucobacter massiliensis]|uniref:Ribonuclease P protein component n=1 Tax=Leucobacter massiliensis TaxID=1686285 RepID=A0A2S9QRX0_9MICO|nr:ribonuclease P protein component [Leucobacter massiliensis]PRI12329.1 ribonuclease P protein component [Leucobacter massiliensis]